MCCDKCWSIFVDGCIVLVCKCCGYGYVEKCGYFGIVCVGRLFIYYDVDDVVFVVVYCCYDVEVGSVCVVCFDVVYVVIMIY